MKILWTVELNKKLCLILQTICKMMKPAEDTPYLKGQRKKLIDELREKKMLNEEVLDAMMEVPRHWFFESAFYKYAYQDRAFEIGAGQTISQPYTVAFQTTLLETFPGCKVLEIGTGSGYQAVVLAALGCKVFTIERQRLLYEKFKLMHTALPSYKTRIKYFFGDGYKGLPAFAPFERILVTCGAPDIPGELVDQLKPGGIMVIPLGGGDVQVMTKILKGNDGKISVSEHGEFRFVPMISDKAKF